ncbi:hypothetical protein [Stenotrophomonas sp.]|uniref:hypothetical protein n=1 Tax=Stenotrophomonas sp. TaxID=69392 RepID=UPI0028B16317|nr:hypothetical protein [Stenotrophomonas sp.]
MSVPIRWCVAACVLVLANGWGVPGRAQEASAEDQIEVAGVMEIIPGGRTLGSIRLDDGRCFDLALPRDVLTQRRRWDGKRVVASGPLMYRPQGVIEGMMWFDIKDRKVEGFGCSENIIYVEGIRRL